MNNLTKPEPKHEASSEMECADVATGNPKPEPTLGDGTPPHKLEFKKLRVTKLPAGQMKIKPPVSL